MDSKPASLKTLTQPETGAVDNQMRISRAQEFRVIVHENLVRPAPERSQFSGCNGRLP